MIIHHHISILKNHITWYIYDNVWTMIIRKAYIGIYGYHIYWIYLMMVRNIWNMIIRHIIIKYYSWIYSPFLFNGYINYKWQISIAMLNYQRLFLKTMEYQKNFVGIWWGDDGDTKDAWNINGLSTMKEKWDGLRLIDHDMTRAIKVHQFPSCS